MFFLHSIGKAAASVGLPLPDRGAGVEVEVEIVPALGGRVISSPLLFWGMCERGEYFFLDTSMYSVYETK